MKLKNFTELHKYLSPFIPKETTYKFPASFGLERTKYFLNLLDNPQNKVKTIHIAGTSGKGSTAYFMSCLLTNLGYKTGLQVSPHLLDVRERAQINNSLLDESTFLNYMNEIIPSIENMKSSRYGYPSIFEILTVLSFYIFWKEKVNFSVVETGLGGLYDATNTITGVKKWIILTKIGLDHTTILGKTIDKIALQKAEIITSNSTVVSAPQFKQAQQVIDNIAHIRNADIFYLKKKKYLKNLTVINNSISFTFSFNDLKIHNLQLQNQALYQVENCALALIMTCLLAQQSHISLDLEKITTTLHQSHFPGRFDITHLKGKEVILDGAHNPQKMSAFVRSLKTFYPNRKFHFLISFKKGKDYKDMLRYIIPIADRITLTDFFVKDENLTNISEKPSVIYNIIKTMKFNNIEIINNPKQAFIQTLNSPITPLIITGSLYFLSVIYKELKTKEGTLL